MNRMSKVFQMQNAERALTGAPVGVRTFVTTIITTIITTRSRGGCG